MATEHLLHLGSPDRDQGGIYRARFDQTAGCFVGPAELLVEATGASWLIRHPDAPVLYATGEAGRHTGARPGTVSAWTVAADGNLTHRSQQAVGAEGPCYCSVTQQRDWLLVACYRGGSVSALPLSADGRIGVVRTVIEHHGETGPHPQRQERSHAHCFVPTPDSAYALSCDLGLDRIIIYRLDSERGIVEHSRAAVHPGGGPRHCAFAPDGRTVIVSRELDGHLDVFDWSAEGGTLVHRQSVRTLPEDFTATNTCSEVAFAGDDHYALIANRGHDSLCVFARQADRSYVLLARVGTPAHPRHFAVLPGIDPGDGWVLVAGRDDDQVRAYRLVDGVPEPSNAVLAMPAPTSICIAP